MSIATEAHGAIPSSVVDRVTLIVGAFQGNARLTLTEVSRLTGIPRTSSFRSIERLVRVGWLRRAEIGYELGPALTEIGLLAAYRTRLDASVTSLLTELHHATGHIVHMGVLDGKDVLYLRKIGGDDEQGLMTRVGSRVPARSSTIGKAILATMPTTLPAPPSPRSVAAPDAAGGPPQVRDRGVAFGTCPTGFSCIGAHVGVLAGAAVGISVTAPSGDIRFDRRDAAPVRMAAAALALHLSTTSPVQQR
ncbi:IclR family transcriptional regulator [Rhodococcus sp. NPDC058505]|uniref:IclR family transcriptional regulator n=1 Tax=unclassified Rhodococcus (in: high G+C Gram-positive bacteria) TaxID=192944 RepID=UPI00365675D3